MEFTLLDAPEINAFATPGGKVYIAHGLVEKMTNEAQLAGVLGHEIIGTIGICASEFRAPPTATTGASTCAR